MIDDRYSLENLEFRGVTRFEKSFLVRHLYSDESSVLPFVSDAPFDQALIQADANRLQQLYQAYGYFDAVVTASPPLLDPEERTASVRFDVQEGLPTLVQSVRFVWEGEGQELLSREAVRQEVTLAPGGAFETPRYNASLGALSTRLKSLGYPLAQVAGQTRIDRDRRQAHTVFRLIPGPRATVGEIRFEGLAALPLEPLKVEVQFAKGQRYSPLLMQEIEQVLRSLRVFDWVAVKPPEAVQGGEVEVVVQVSEADPQSLRFGAEVSIDTIRWQEQLRADYTHTNLFGQLARLDLHTTVGWAQLPNPLNVDLQGPVIEVRPELTKKGLLEDHLRWSEAPQFVLGLNQGYQYYSLGNRLGVSRWFLRRLRLGLGHEVEVVDFFNTTPRLDPRASVLGLDFRDPYLLSAPYFTASWFLVDRVASPTNGAIFQSMHSISEGRVGSDFNFYRTTITGTFYLKMASWLQTASRVRAGWILPFGDQASVPFKERFYLGRANSVRGWGSRRLAPQVRECGIGESTTCENIPVGGNTMIQGNLEGRFRLSDWLVGVGFLDVGDVQSEAATFLPEQWNYSAGPGVRVDTRFGLLRLDLGIRLNRTGAFPEERGWAVHFGFGEAL